jgi:hypothetical protein
MEFRNDKNFKNIYKQVSQPRAEEAQYSERSTMRSYFKIINKSYRVNLKKNTFPFSFKNDDLPIFNETSANKLKKN